jgi:hypothetical protein
MSGGHIAVPIQASASVIDNSGGPRRGHLRTTALMGQIESHLEPGQTPLPGRDRRLGPLWASTLTPKETTRLIGALAVEPAAREQIEQLLGAMNDQRRRRMVKHIARRLAGSLTTTGAVLPALNDLALELNAEAVDTFVREADRP